MKRISVLPKGCLTTAANQSFNPNLERHLKELGEHANVSTTIQASGDVNYVQNGATITVQINAKSVQSGNSYTLPASAAFDTFLNEYVTTSGNTVQKYVAVTAGSTSITLDPGDTVIVSGSYLSKLEV